MCKELDFSQSDHKALAKRIQDGQVSLFLGAGFSLGAVGSYRDGETGKRLSLPSVKELKKILLNDVLSEDSMDESLKEICEECKEDNLLKYERVMKQLFDVSSITDFQEMYAELDWKSIYTINVDNVVETAYKRRDKGISCVYTEEPIHTDKGALLYYKLHGDAIHDPGKIVFSVTDYVSNTGRRPDYRFEQLGAALKTDNFLFVGTSLDEEWDFDIKCNQSDVYQVPNKTYFVLPEYNDRQVKRIRRRFRNAVLICETAESFIHKMTDYIAEIKPGIHMQSFEKWDLKRISRKNYDVESYLKPDFYLGSEPTWEDIFSNHDVVWEKTREAMERFKEETGKVFTLIIGKPIAGKTTMLYRFGAELCDESLVFEYIGGDLDNLKESLRHLKTRSEAVVILVDDANWLLGRIQDILEVLCDSHVKLIAAVREKEYEKRRHLFDSGVSEKIIEIRDINRLTDVDIKHYLDKLEEKTFLGGYSRDYHRYPEKTVQKLKQQINKKQEDPLLWLAYKMKYGNELDRRILQVSNSIISSTNYNIKRLAVLLYFLDVIGDTGLKLSLFLELYPMKEKELQDFVNDVQDLMISNIRRSSWEKMEYKKIIIHGRFSEIIRKAVLRIPRQELCEMIEDIFRRLDEQYHYKCRQSNTYLNYVLYTLLRSQNLSEMFRNSKTKGVEWKYINNLYENLHPYYNDYYIYWLHRGISEIKMQKYTSARIHLEQASATRNGYSYEIEHTFAILYFEQAIHCTKMPKEERFILYNDGLKIVKGQIDHETNDAFTIHSFIVKTIKFYDSIGDPIPEDLMREIIEEYNKARKKFGFNQSIIRRNMFEHLYDYWVRQQGVYSCSLTVSQEELAYLLKKNNTVDLDILDLMESDY